jgi:hypothetical protein
VSGEPPAAARGACLELFRIDFSSRAWMFLGPATAMIMAGAMGICTVFVTHGPLAGTDWYAIVGSACMLAGLALAVVVSIPMFTHDEYLAALEGGILWRLEREEGFLPWADVREVSWDTEHAAVLIARRDGEPIQVVRKFGRTTADQVAVRLEDFRRKASFNLIR